MDGLQSEVKVLARVFPGREAFRHGVGVAPNEL
jgi:hypothetical protein